MVEEKIDLQVVIEGYLEAYDQRDLSRCMEFFADDAKIHFASGVYRGKDAIEGWHQDRFAADLRVLKVERIKTNGEKVTVDLIATSNVAKAWKLDKGPGRATVIFDGDKIKEAKFGLRMALPIEGW